MAIIFDRTQDFIEQRSQQAPLLTAKAISGGSQFRQSQLQEEIAEGKIRDSQYSPYNSGPKTSSLGVVAGSISKTGTASNLSTVGQGFQGGSGTARQTQEIYSPLWLDSNLSMPRDRATINTWCRAFFATNPIVRRAITLHSTYPISKINIICKDKRRAQDYEQMVEELDLVNVCRMVAQEYFVLGEAFIYAKYDENKRNWSKLLIQNPDYVSVVPGVVDGEPLYSLIPDENLKKIVNGNRPSDLMQRQQLDKSIIQHVKKGQNIPLSSFHISHLANKSVPYESRGTSILVSCFKALMLFDKIRESKFAQAANMINPLTIIKIGGAEHKPLPGDIERYRDIFEQAQYDKDFKIFTHNELTVERVGANGGILDVTNDITQIMSELYQGLMVPKVIMDGQDITYANGGVSLDVLKTTYLGLQKQLSYWLKRHIFLPIARMQGWYEKKDGRNVAILPEIEWNHMNLFDANDYIANLNLLLQGETSKVSLHTMYRSLGLDYEEEQRKMRLEQINGTILAKEKAILAEMSLADLRALKPEDEIKESVESPLPGEQSTPGEEAGGSGGGAAPPPPPAS